MSNIKLSAFHRMYGLIILVILLYNNQTKKQQILKKRQLILINVKIKQTSWWFKFWIVNSYQYKIIENVIKK